ncbi:MAG: hypothetical protein ACLR1T_02055 [Evtepia gabavorous]
MTRGYDLALETCGVFDFDRMAPALGKMNQIFMDLKHPDPMAHRRFTGLDNRLDAGEPPADRPAGPAAGEFGFP